MNRILRNEFRKLFRTKSFWIILALLTFITATIAFTQSTQVASYIGGINSDMPKSENGFFFEDNCPYAYSLNNTWIGALSGEQFFTTIFYFILPLAATLPFCFSYLDEKQSGYLRQMVLINGQTKYFVSKYIVTFCSGFLTATIPIIINLVITACYLPAFTPDPLEQLYSNQSYGIYAADIYFSKPTLFIILFTLIPGVFCGLWSVISMCLSMFVQNKYIVVIVPYLFLFFEKSFFDMLFSNRIRLELSPFYFMRGSSFGNIYIVLAILLTMFIVSFCLTILKGKKDDIY